MTAISITTAAGLTGSPVRGGDGARAIEVSLPRAVGATRSPRGARETRTVRLALAGCGVVGTAFVKELLGRRATIAERHETHFEIVTILVRDLEAPRDAAIDRGLLTNCVDTFLAAQADIVIEAIGGLDPARRIAECALGSGRRLITANKALVALHGDALSALADENETSLRFDAAVGGGVPVVRVLDDALGAGTPSRIRAILNGTTNYVLSRLEEGIEQDRAIADARAAGFAEADCTRDLDGRDAADKLALIAWSAFHVAPDCAAIECVSLLPDPKRTVDLASRIGGCVRQVGESADVEGAIVSVVEPLVVDRASVLGRTRDEQNHVEVHNGWSSPLSASGPGAGGIPTAVALLSDLLAGGARSPRRQSLRSGSEDPRSHDWVIEIRGTPSQLHHAIPGCRHVEADALATCAWTVARGLTRRSLRAIVQSLEGAGAAPLTIRLDPSFCADGILA